MQRKYILIFALCFTVYMCGVSMLMNENSIAAQLSGARFYFYLIGNLVIGLILGVFAYKYEQRRKNRKLPD